jgi:tetratricopeptide (TPR) repeat protein
MFHMGKVVEASEQFGKIVKLRDSRHIRDLEESRGVNYWVQGLAWGAHALWCLGQVDSALDNARHAVAYAQEFEQPFNQALSLTYMASLQEWCTDPDTFLVHAKEAYTFTSEYQVTYYHSWASILLHFGLAWQEPEPKNLAKLREAIRIFIDMGSHLRLPVFYSLLARASHRAGKIDEGLEAVELGLTEALQNGERWWDAELHRLRGELLWAQGGVSSEIEGAFQHALQIAQEQHSKSLELRAAHSLARYWKTRSRSPDAKQLLIPLYEKFIEGLNSPDLQAAHALIIQLTA